MRYLYLFIWQLLFLLFHFREYGMTEDGFKVGENMNSVRAKEAAKRWYAVYTRPRAEKQVFRRLEEAGIETFLPLQKTIRKWSDRKKLVEKPLLSSYIFIKTKTSFFPAVYTLPGVVRIVTFEGKPVAIPQYQIDNLRLLVDSNADVEVTKEHFGKGDMVEVTVGSLKGLTGELIRIGSQKKMVIRLEKLEQNIIVTIPVTFLKKKANPAG